MTAEWPRLVGGSAILVAGSSIAGLYSFRGAVPVVFVGFCLFTLGYLVARDGRAALDPTALSASGESSGRLDHPAVRGGLGLVGIYIIAIGVTQFSRTVVDPSLTSAVLAGCFSIGGYAWTHVLIHHKLF